MKQILQSALVLSVLAGAAEAATVVNTNLTLTTNPPVADIYGYGGNGAGNTWTVTGNITVGDGTNADSRLFIGTNGFAGTTGSGILTLTGDGIGGADSITLNGFNGADAILGRFGQVSSAFSGTLNITGGLGVTFGGRKMRYAGNAGVVETINITNGSLNYTTTGFGWTEEGNGAVVSHVIGSNGSLLVSGNFTDAAGFDARMVTLGSGVESGDVTVTAASGLTLQFTAQGGNTLITAVPEPSAAIALLGGTATLLGLRRRRFVA